MKAVCTIQFENNQWVPVLYLPDNYIYLLGCSTKDRYAATAAAKTDANRLKIPFVDYAESFFSIKPLGNSFIPVKVTVMGRTETLDIAASTDFDEIFKTTQKIAEQKKQIFVPNFF